MTGAYRTIATPEDIAEAVEALAAAEPRFAAIVQATGQPALRRSEPGLKGLLRIVTEQMISLKAAEAIWSRIELALHPCDHEAVLRRRQATLMKLGLSGHKARSFHALAQAVRDGALPLERFDTMSDQEIMAALTALHGIGAWTAEIYLLSCLGRADVWPAGDVALQTAAQHAFGLPSRPTEREMRDMAEAWRPWRAVAARLLWAHYRHVKGMPQLIL
jgi:DNA-3-methyladenine glycosylase II